MTGGKQWLFAALIVAAGTGSPAYAADVPEELELTVDVLHPGEALDGETVNRIRLPDSIIAPGDAEEAPPPDHVGAEPGSPEDGDGSEWGWESPAPPERPTRPGN